MRVSLVVTFTGADRPGIVETLSKTVAAHDGNWEESRMANLAGRFAGLLKATVEQAEAPKLTDALQRLSDEGLRIFVEQGSGETTSQRQQLQVELVGTDRPGIVREVSGVFASDGINIEELSTERRAAPMSGEPMFVAHVALTCVPDLDLDHLRHQLEQLADDLMVDLSLATKVGRSGAQ